MRITKPLTHESMLHIAAKGGCVMCALLKSHQSALLEEVQPGALSQVCNYHGWSIAAAANARSAAETFLHLLDKDTVGKTSCDFCMQIRQEEEKRLKELSRVIAEPEVLEWVRAHNVLCHPHTSKVASAVSPDRRSDVLAVNANNHKVIESNLRSFLGELGHDTRSGAGVLGRAAEFLFGYRGMPRQDKP